MPVEGSQSKCESDKCKNCAHVTFMEPAPASPRPGPKLNLKPVLNSFNHSTYRNDYPGHMRISPPLLRRPQDALPIATDFKTQYVTTCQERFKPWDMNAIQRCENKAPRRDYAVPEVSCLMNGCYVICSRNNI